MSILINHNFSEGDYHIILTFAGEEPTQEEARRHLDNFKKNIRRRYKKRGEELKWIAVTEYHNKRIHHHMIVNKELPINEIAHIWGKGTCWLIFARGITRRVKTKLDKIKCTLCQGQFDFLIISPDKVIQELLVDLPTALYANCVLWL